MLSVLAAALVVAAGTGCSGDDRTDAADTTSQTTTAASATKTTKAVEKTETTETQPDTRPEPKPDQSRWARQVDAVCKPWQRRIDALAPPSDAASLERFLAEVVPLAHKQVAFVKAVKPPADDDEARMAKLFVAAIEQLESGLTRYLAAIRRNDAAAVQKALTDANAAGAQARGYAVSLNITECGGYASG